MTDRSRGPATIICLDLPPTWAEHHLRTLDPLRTLLQSRWWTHLTRRAGTESLIGISHTHALHPWRRTESETRWTAHSWRWTGEETWWRTHIGKWWTTRTIRWTTQARWATTHQWWRELVRVRWHWPMTWRCLALLEKVRHVREALWMTHIGLEAGWWRNSLVTAWLILAVEKGVIRW